MLQLHNPGRQCLATNQSLTDPRAWNQEKTKPCREGAQQPKSYPSLFYLSYPSHLSSRTLAPPCGYLDYVLWSPPLQTLGKVLGFYTSQHIHRHTHTPSMGSIPGPQRTAWLASLLELLTGTQGAWPAARGSSNNLGFGLKQHVLQNL